MSVYSFVCCSWLYMRVSSNSKRSNDFNNLRSLLKMFFILCAQVIDIFLLDLKWYHLNVSLNRCRFIFLKIAPKNRIHPKKSWQTEWIEGKKSYTSIWFYNQNCLVTAVFACLACTHRTTVKDTKQVTIASTAMIINRWLNVEMKFKYIQSKLLLWIIHSHSMLSLPFFFYVSLFSHFTACITHFRICH